MGIIRLLLAIAVLNSHFTFVEVPIVGGHEAVLAFFAISGFYMALILDTNYASAKGFYMGRFLSLYPMYVLALIVSISLLTTWNIHPMIGMDQIRTLLSDPLSFFLMLWTSACVFGQELLFSLAASPDGGLHFVTASKHGIWAHAPLIQAWSLSLEILFYALAPLLVRLSSRSLIGLVVASIAAKLLIMNSPYADVVFFKRFFPIEFWLFGSGILAYRFYRTLAPGREAIDYFAFIFVVGFILVVGDVDDALKPFALPVATLLALPFVFRAFQALQFDRNMGKISYPFYLLHFSVIAIFEEYWEEPSGWHILALTLVVATLVHLIFNPGIEHFKQRMRRQKQSSFDGELVVQPDISIIKP
ncbi:acyltransferase [Pseudodesulfovibrio sp. zrk46]|uniref:acyltransferase family protein n=1 Tax=Pseudodesulfovibrio sp. zrk46 TaxID=2725288 RepID=UPI001448E4B5|nr:acyltransferase [Pseudodesulfovibrio sp. zrk46]QJB56820.1 acyltransferase [Pseudodesulfovibrio sp. zrk46]